MGEESWGRLKSDFAVSSTWIGLKCSKRSCVLNVLNYRKTWGLPISLAQELPSTIEGLMTITNQSDPHTCINVYEITLTIHTVLHCRQTGAPPVNHKFNNSVPHCAIVVLFWLSQSTKNCKMKNNNNRPIIILERVSSSSVKVCN